MTNKIQTEFGNVGINKDGYRYITSSKEGNYGKTLHKLIYEKHYGKVPEGFEVHHKDWNKLNNDIMNLELMTKYEHRLLHNKDKNVSDEIRKKMSKAKKGKNHPKFNSCIKIHKIINKRCKQGYTWIAYPSSNGKCIGISSVDLNKCIKKVEEFIKSELNVYGYNSYEVIYN